jgi:hypothetical protein
MAAAVRPPVFSAASASVRPEAPGADRCQEATSAIPASTTTADATAATRRQRLPPAAVRRDDRRRIRGPDFIKAAFLRASFALI